MQRFAIVVAPCCNNSDDGDERGPILSDGVYALSVKRLLALWELKLGAVEACSSSEDFVTLDIVQRVQGIRGELLEFGSAGTERKEKLRCRMDIQIEALRRDVSKLVEGGKFVVRSK
jgi:hypothetical protein